MIPSTTIKGLGFAPKVPSPLMVIFTSDLGFPLDCDTKTPANAPCNASPAFADA